MPEILYFSDAIGHLNGRWPGNSSYVKGVGSRKIGQQPLGLVVNKEKNLLWNRTQGYFVFDTTTHTCLAPDPQDIPDAASFQPDGCKPLPV